MYLLTYIYIYIYTHIYIYIYTYIYIYMNSSKKKRGFSDIFVLATFNSFANDIFCLTLKNLYSKFK